MAAKKKARKKKGAAHRAKQRSVYLRNFTGRVSQNRDKTISIMGKGRRGR